MKSWTMFLIAIGFLLVAVSPQMAGSMGYVITGLVLVLIGVILLKRSNRTTPKKPAPTKPAPKKTTSKKTASNKTTQTKKK